MIETHVFKTDSEKLTAKLFNDFELKCVDLDYVVKTTSGLDLGEIDGIFVDDTNEIVFIYDDSELQSPNSKIVSFFQKWSTKNNLEELIKLKSLPDDYQYYILYVDKTRDSNEKVKLDPIKNSIPNNCIVIFNDDFNYYQQLTKEIKKWGKNDFYNFLELKPKNKTSVKRKVIKYFIGDTPAYVFSDKAEKILQYSYVYRRSDKSNIGYQRALNKDKIRLMRKFINSGDLDSFPNSILLNCVEKITEIIDPTTGSAEKADCPKEIEIDIPNYFCSCRVVDGQHRLLSLCNVENTIISKFSLPIVLFNNMDVKKEIKTFIEINDNQTSIDKNLTISLKAQLDWSLGSKEYLEKIAYLICEQIITKNPSFSNRIYKGHANESTVLNNNKKITIQQFIQSIIKNKIVQKNVGIIQTSLNDIDTPAKVINNTYNTLIGANGKNANYYYSNRGMDLILRFIGIIHINIKLGYFKSTFEDALSDFNLNINKVLPTITSYYGAGAVAKSFDSLFLELKKSSTKYDNIENDLRKLNFKK
jgi:DGQHR domain-containing protein